MMSHPYVVVTGDTLTKIAHKFRKRSWREIYDAPENAPFRRRRPNPDRIFPGDMLVIPGTAPPAAPPPRTDGIVPVVGIDEGGDGLTHVSDPNGAWEAVIFRSTRVTMQAHKRSRGLVSWGAQSIVVGIPGQKDFETTINGIRGGRKDCVVVQGGFQNNPVNPLDKGYFMGRLIIAGDSSVRVTADDPERRERAAVSFFNDAGRSPSGRHFHFTHVPNGVPVIGCDHGMGSLVTMLIDGRKPTDDSFWEKQIQARGTIGLTVLAQRRSDEQLMIWTQREPKLSSGSGGNFREPNDIRAGFIAAGFDDAVLLDGSDSVMMDVRGKRIIDPSSLKQKLNQTFLSFAPRGGGSI